DSRKKGGSASPPQTSAIRLAAFIFKGANHDRNHPSHPLDSLSTGRRLRLPQRQQHPRRGWRSPRVNPAYPPHSGPVARCILLIESPIGGGIASGALKINGATL